MKIEITSDVDTLSKGEVVQQLVNCGAIELDCEKIGESRIECGCDLEIDIMHDEPEDPRINGCLSRTETFTLADIRDWFTEGDAYAWATDEDGDEILLCLAN